MTILLRALILAVVLAALFVFALPEIFTAWSYLQ